MRNTRHIGAQYRIACVAGEGCANLSSVTPPEVDGSYGQRPLASITPRSCMPARFLLLSPLDSENSLYTDLHTAHGEQSVHRSTHSTQRTICTRIYTQHTENSLYTDLHTAHREQSVHGSTHNTQRTVCTQIYTQHTENSLYTDLHTAHREQSVHGSTHSTQRTVCIQIYTQHTENSLYTDLHTAHRLQHQLLNTNSKQ